MKLVRNPPLKPREEEEEVSSSDGEVKRSEPEKLSNQLYQKKVYYSKLFKTFFFYVGHLVVIKMNNTFQSAVIHYS